MPDRLWNRELRPGSTLRAMGTGIIQIARRIQRPRRRGQGLPEGAIYVGRPTIWGNPFEGRNWRHAKATILHSNWLDGRIGALTMERMGFHPSEIDAFERRRCTVLTQLYKLAGHDLACWCSPKSQWCHADTLLRMAPLHSEYERFAV